MSPRPQLRSARLIELQAALADSLRVATGGKLPTVAHQPRPLPPGMKWLVTPREALEAHDGDATTMRICFDRFLFWRLTLGAQRPSTASLIKAGERLRALALWALAIRAQQAGRPLPLKDEKPAYEVPATYVSQMVRDQLLKSIKAHRHPTARKTRAIPAAEVQRASFPGENTDGNGGPDPGQQQQQQNSQEYQQYLADYAELEQMTHFWSTWGSVTPEQLQTLVGEMPQGVQANLSGLLTSSDYIVGGNLLDFETMFAGMEAAGLTQFEMQRTLEAWWNGQAAVWAGQDMLTQAGVAGSFDLTDPAFYDYLKNQAGYRIVNIEEMTRVDIAESLWQAMGGTGGPGIGSVKTLGSYIADEYRLQLEVGTKFTADWRGYMIGLTETSRAENFGAFVGLYQTGATNKIWVVNAGACQICIGNAEAGPVPLMQSFPSGVMSPPTHPCDRCAISSAVPETFDPSQWQSRDPSDLSDLLTNWTGAGWPDVDLADMAAALEYAQMPQETRRRTVQLSTAQEQALGPQLGALVQDIGKRWLLEAHVRMPETEADLRTLAKRLRTPDELPDAREADEQALHRLKVGVTETVARVLREG